MHHLLEKLQVIKLLVGQGNSVTLALFDVLVETLVTTMSVAVRII
jgi:hypothetical protein